MLSKYGPLIVVLVPTIMVICILKSLPPSERPSDNKFESYIKSNLKLVKQRNSMSTMLNQLKQEYGQLSCHNLQLRAYLGEEVYNI